ncbi:MAG: divergent polysaccharide deacetylase family protein [candidate division KSB1 bacterium]|nr:divergent polysaccharide deacetylase family protein [candidate division KSB1 bacterium]MDZ7301752.1 divergent polysaccharide deacetylase family protein [candidate division KSB1 bacterium]MDZ7311469.1 divergent polysaccharide deacetylase family protein [candidate division KSB1 bacterium]
MKKKSKQVHRRGIPEWQKNLTLVFSVGIVVILGVEFVYRKVAPTPRSEKNTSSAPVRTSSKNPLPKIKTPTKDERIRLATDRVLTNFGIRLDWIKYRGNDREVRVPKELHPLVIYQVLSNQVRQLGGKVESGTEDLRTGETELTYSFAGKTLGKIRLIPDPKLTRHAGKIAIIIDDFGYAVNDVVNDFLDLKIPVTYSIIPGLKSSVELAERLHKAGKSVLIHMPMQPLERKVENDGYTVLLDMKEEEIRKCVHKAISAVPHAIGMNNHMGSATTVRDSLLRPVFDELKNAGLFFIDSRTNPNSRGFMLAKKMGLETDINDMFLDNENNLEQVQQKIWQLADLAAQRGSAIAIGHPHRNTLQAIQEIGPQLIQRGFELVSVEQLVRKQPPTEKMLAQRTN